ncbi:MAG: hypothetical protein PF961_09570 [Planctomycetota bacterium]|jgi:hypothetical protein|nr:hypothetical protein [Planctomycetota bacterium]
MKLSHLAVACTLSLLGLRASEAQIDFVAVAQPASQVCAGLSELLGAEQRIDTDLVSSLANQPCHLALVAASPEQSAQALGHALGAWWVPLAAAGERRYTRAVGLPPTGRVQVRAFPSRLSRNPGLEDTVRALMLPWLGGERGLALHAPLGRWNATLDAGGHSELLALIGRIERPKPGIPALIPHPNSIAGDEQLSTTVKAASWSDLVRRMAAASGHSIALAPKLTAQRLAKPITVHPAPLDEIPLQLTAQGIPSAWIAGVLCCGGQAQEALHPALRRQWATIPVGHLAADPVALTALVARLQHEAAPAWWSQPGAGMVILEDQGLLVVAADQAALAAVMNRLRHIDHNGGMQP